MARSSQVVAAVLCAAVCAQAGDWTFKAVLNTQTMTGPTDLKTGGTDVIAIGVHTDGASGVIRSFHRFDLSALPATATVSAVTFRMRTQNNQGTLPTTIRLVKLDTTNVMDTSVSWTRLNAATNWATGGGDVGEVLATLTPVWSNNAEFTFMSSNALVAAVQDALANRGGVFQMLLYSPEHEAAHPIPQTTGGFIRMHARNTAFAAELAVSANVSPEAPGADSAPWFGVDYHDTSNVQPGFSAGGSVVSGSIALAVTNAFGDGGAVTSILTSSSGNLQTRVRQDIGNTTSNALLRDLVFASNGDLTLTLRGLRRGPYLFRAWFNDSYIGSPTGLDGDYEARVDGQVVDTWQATYTLDANTGIGACEFVVEAQAGADLVLEIVNTTAGKHTMINGYQVTRLPRVARGTVIMLR